MSITTNDPLAGDRISDLTLAELLDRVDGASACMRPERIKHKPLKGAKKKNRTTMRLPLAIDEQIAEYCRLTNRSKNEMIAIFLCSGMSHYRVQGSELIYDPDACGSNTAAVRSNSSLGVLCDAGSDASYGTTSGVTK